jgi:hypothetical protein
MSDARRFFQPFTAEEIRGFKESAARHKQRINELRERMARGLGPDEVDDERQS